MTDLVEKTLHSKTIFEGKVIDLRVDTVELPNGETSTREIVKHPGAVAVIALTDEGKLVLVQQYRKPLEKLLFEIPAGKLDPGEALETCALRELEEETGYRCRSIEHVVSFYTSPGFSDELIHIYFTDTLIRGERHLDEDEFLENYEVDLQEALQLLKEKKIDDAKTVYAVQYLQMQQ
ncbi:ADP-ribose pyrophosphatase [Pullulanibacillus pueri]|uniref:ADP-ribose pyrophosphatase n=1 Tax=Pullulanibacillus pueri TaxID=1437324 RepID=A0A8J2ZUU6_9BACL|nr:NUDIX hydrolase [Pullulanibacillus pueri]MBM7681660.1 ADP-ribose pyrophosphatase [Pullulanibacillus pueri]GGH79270.1 ADP-ribose pyrophosphatase [Pullulanibacillus pueri]